MKLVPVYPISSDELSYPCFKAAFEARKAQGVRLESELIDISDVEFIAAQLSKGDKLPTCTFTFNVQQTFHLVRLL